MITDTRETPTTIQMFSWPCECMCVCVIVLIQEVLSIDVSEAAEEGQGVQSVWMSDPHITSNSLDQASEALQLCHHVVWTHKHT